MLSEKEQMLALSKAIHNVMDGWKDSQPSNIVLTRPGTMVEFFYICGNIEEDGSEALYEFLRSAYTNEIELCAAIDRVGLWFEKQVKNMSQRNQVWSEYSDIRARTKAMNRVMNDMSGDKRKQVLFVAISMELAKTIREIRNG